MTELTNQLRQLGEATEAAVDPATVDDAMSRAPQMIDLDSATVTPVRPAKPKRAGRVLAAAAALIVVAFASVLLTTRGSDQPGITTAAQPDESPIVSFDDNGWEALRQCESSGNYRTDTGNTFYGAYQFTQETWDQAAAFARIENYAGVKPSSTPPEVQDALAASLYLEKGSEPWPVCGDRLTGPMITPVIPHWLPGPPGGDEIILFLDEGTTPEQLFATADAATEILGRDGEVTISWLSEDQATSDIIGPFDDPEILATLIPDGVPMSLRLGGPNISRFTAGNFRNLPNVGTAVDAPAVSPLYEGAGMRLIIDAIDVDVRTWTTPAIRHLERGVALHGPIAITFESESPLSSYMGPTERTLAITGYRDGEGAPFARLDELELGDIVEVQTLLHGVDDVVRVDRYEVAGPYPTYDGGGPNRTLEQLQPWKQVPHGGLHLITTGDTPTERLTFFAVPLPADKALFGTHIGE